MPTKGEPPHTIRNNNSPITSNQNSENKQVNLNNATESELKGVPGIGPTKAKEIINYREQNGRFDKIDDLKRLKGLRKRSKIKRILYYLTLIHYCIYCLK